MENDCTLMIDDLERQNINLHEFSFIKYANERKHCSDILWKNLLDQKLTNTDASFSCCYKGSPLEFFVECKTDSYVYKDGNGDLQLSTSNFVIELIAAIKEDELRQVLNDELESLPIGKLIRRESEYHSKLLTAVSYVENNNLKGKLGFGMSSSLNNHNLLSYMFVYKENDVAKHYVMRGSDIVDFIRKNKENNSLTVTKTAFDKQNPSRFWYTISCLVPINKIYHYDYSG